jgi:hypothetical protein
MTGENRNKLMEIVRKDAIVRGFYMYHLRGDMALDDALVSMVERLASDNRTLFDLAVDLRSKMARPEIFDLTYPTRSE